MARKFGVFLFLAMLLISLLPSCSAPAQNAGNSQGEGFPYTFTDSAGNEITLDKRPQKVAGLFSSFADLWQTAGGDVAVTVGDSVKRGFCPDGTPLVDDGSGINIDIELLVSYEPDFVIGSADMAAQLEAVEKLDSMGIPAAAFKVESVSDYVGVLDICTDITGEKENYATYGTDVEAGCDKIIADASAYAGPLESPVKVLFIRAGSGDSSTKAKTAENHFVGTMLQELKTENIADEAGILSDHLSLEHIVANQPDIILIVPQGDEEASKSYVLSLFEKSGWRDLDAVKSENYHFLPKDLFNYKPNARWAESYEYLAELIYPEM